MGGGIFDQRFMLRIFLWKFDIANKTSNYFNFNVFPFLQEASRVPNRCGEV